MTPAYHNNKLLRSLNWPQFTEQSHRKTFTRFQKQSLVIKCDRPGNITWNDWCIFLESIACASVCG